MADPAVDPGAERIESLGHRYFVRFEEDTLRQRPLWIRLIIEFLGTFVLVTVAAGSGVINHYVGNAPISRTAAVIAPGAVVMAMIYAWGPLSGLHINPAVTFAFTARGVFPTKWVVPYWVVQFAGAICAALFLQLMFGDVSAGGNYPINTSGGEWKSFVMETVLTAILASIILNTATGARSIGHNAAIAVGSTVALLGLFASPISGASMNPARTPRARHRRQRLHRLVGLCRGPGARSRHRRGDHRSRARTAGQGRARGRRGRRPADDRHPHARKPVSRRPADMLAPGQRQERVAMTAEPPEGQAGERSLEVRWMFPGRLETAVAGWFGRFPIGTESREDSYLLDPRLPGLSVKVRGGRALEVKMYHGSPGILERGGPRPGTPGVLAEVVLSRSAWPTRTATARSAGGRLARAGAWPISHWPEDRSWRAPRSWTTSRSATWN